jgi:hypothetical protein
MSLRDDIAEKKKELEESVTYLAEEIVIIDAAKEMYDAAINILDEKLTTELDLVNESISDVQRAYENRIVSGCRTDVFWRLTGIHTGGPSGTTKFHTLTATQISYNGYEVGTGVTSPTGIGTILAVVDNVGGIGSESAKSSRIGLERDNLHGIKFTDQPITHDVGDTTVGSFIGTVGIGSTTLTVMTPYSDNLWTDFKVGQLVISGKPEVFGSLEETNTIAGFSSAISDLSGISSTGIGVTSVPIIQLKTPTVGFATDPEEDGNFVTFKVLSDPAGIVTYNDYAIPFTSNPFSPETIGIMNGANLGVGRSVFYVNSGISSSPRSWKPEFAISGYEDEGIEDVVAPEVGAGYIFYKKGFDQQPIDPVTGDPAVVGSVSVVSGSLALATLYQSLPSCGSTVADELTANIARRDLLESNLASDIGTFQLRLDAANALRAERDESYNARIHSLRAGIGAQVDEEARFDNLLRYLDQEELDT